MTAPKLIISPKPGQGPDASVSMLNCIFMSDIIAAHELQVNLRLEQSHQLFPVSGQTKVETLLYKTEVYRTTQITG